MAKLEPNDTFQDRGLIKITDGLFVADITGSGEVKVLSSSELDELIQSKGTEKFIATRDINELFLQILTQLKILVAQNNEVHNLKMGEKDIERS